MDIQASSMVNGEQAEYRAIRDAIGVTHWSDQGILQVSGKGAVDALDEQLTANIENLPEYSVRLSLLLDEGGRTLGQVTVLNMTSHYLVLCDSALCPVLTERLNESGFPVSVDDLSEQLAAISVEGPEAEVIPRELCGIDAASLRLLSFTECRFRDTDGILARVGATGEYGFLFLFGANVAGAFLEWIAQVAPEAVVCSPGVHDLLELEVGYVGVPRDTPRAESALASGLHWMIGFRKPSFVGAERLRRQLDEPPPYRLVGVRVDDHQLLSGEDLKVFLDGDEVGYVGRSAWSPDANATIGFVYMKQECAVVGLQVHIDSAEGMVSARTVTTPFVRTRSSRDD